MRKAKGETQKSTRKWYLAFFVANLFGFLVKSVLGDETWNEQVSNIAGQNWSNFIKNKKKKKRNKGVQTGCKKKTTKGLQTKEREKVGAGKEEYSTISYLPRNVHWES